MSLTILYDLKLTAVQTGGLYYGLATIPVVGYSFLEMLLPEYSMQPFLMVFINLYFMAYFAAIITFYYIYEKQLEC